MIILKSKYSYVPVAALGALIYKCYFKNGFTSAEKLKRFQYHRVRQALLMAMHVPYYRSLFQNIHFNPAYDFNDISDLNRIPTLRKETVRKEFKNLINPAYKGPVFNVLTSGSTGEPLQMYSTWLTIAIERSLIYRHYQWATGTLRPVIFQLRSYVRKASEDPLWRYSFSDNAHCFSASDLSPHTAPLYVQKLEEINPDVIRSYPTSLAFLCDYVTPENARRLTRLKSIIVSSETCTDQVRSKIEAAFKKPVLNWYGMSEPSIIMKQGLTSPEMKISMEYGYPEFRDTEIEDVKSLITTSFFNHCMPFIRYETGDLVKILPGRTTQFGLAPYALTVVGRKDEYLDGEAGARVPAIQLFTLFQNFPEIDAFQIIQFQSHEVLVLYQSHRKLSDETLTRINHQLKMRLGETIPVLLKLSSQFVTNRDGKSLVIIKMPGTMAGWKQ